MRDLWRKPILQATVVAGSALMPRSSAGAKTVESSVKRCRILRRFHPAVFRTLTPYFRRTSASTDITPPNLPNSDGDDAGTLAFPTLTQHLHTQSTIPHL